MMISASAVRTITLITTMMITAVIWSSVFILKYNPRGHGQHGQEHANDHPDNERDHGITSKREEPPGTP